MAPVPSSGFSPSNWVISLQSQQMKKPYQGNNSRMERCNLSAHDPGALLVYLFQPKKVQYSPHRG